MIRSCVTAVLIAFTLLPPLSAQHDHHGMGNAPVPAPDAGMMEGLQGNYPIGRDASGTAWQPDSTAREGAHAVYGAWTAMFHGFADLTWDRQEGPRGDTELFSSNMFMAMAQRELGTGALGLRAMLSLEPATIGSDGYPLLLQTGETADGRLPLIDRQHPHDLFMELAFLYRVPLSESGSVFLYGGLPGEPALGPPVYMHRFSGMNLPDAPIVHHWLDSTHITFGVVTLGYVLGNAKLEGSLFKGREPDENRWDIEEPRLDSHALRLSFNPGPDWALQASYGSLKSPEQLEPEEDLNRYTASAVYNRRLARGNWQTTLTWGRNASHDQELDGVLLESTAQLSEADFLFGRFESVEKDELFPPDDPRSEATFPVRRFELGYLRDVARWLGLRWGIGGSFSAFLLPRELKTVYGDLPIGVMLYTRARL